MAATRRRTKRSGHHGGGGCLVLLFLVLLVTGLWYFFIGDKEPSPRSTPAPEPQPVMSGADVDYRPVANGIYLRLQAALAKQEAEMAWEPPVEKEAERSATGGKIFWQAANIVVRPAEAPDLAAAVAAAAPQQGKLSLSGAERDTWQGSEVDRYELVLAEQPDETLLTLTIGHIYVYAPSGKAAKPAPAEKAPQQAKKPEPAVAVPTPPLPKRSAKGKAKIAFVIDDCGGNLGPQKVYESLGRPFTYAIMPNLEYTREAAESAHSSGGQVILHLPMEPISGQGMEPATILTTMDAATVRQMTADAIGQVPHLIGVNNHQGSKVTADPRTMRMVLREIGRRGLFFLDSRTSASSVAESLAKEMGIRTAANELFIDNSADEDAIRAQIRAAIAIAKRDGYCISIGHCRPHTAAAMRSMIGEIENNGVELVFLSDLVS